MAHGLVSHNDFT